MDAAIGRFKFFFGVVLGVTGRFDAVYHQIPSVVTQLFHRAVIGRLASQQGDQFDDDDHITHKITLSVS